MNDHVRSFGRKLKLHGSLLAGILAVMWGLEIVDLYALNGALDGYGIHPRETEWLGGIALAPFLHGNLAHLMGNTIPFLLFGWIIMLHQVRDFFFVALLSTLVAGVGTWLVGAPGSVHIGASGVVFGLFGFLLLRGWFRRSIGSVLLSVAIFLMYGGILLGVLPTQPGVSWEGHLFGFAGGVLAARMLAGRDRRRLAGQQAAQPVLAA